VHRLSIEAFSLGMGRGQTEKLDTSEKQNKTKRQPGNAPSNQPIVAGVFPQRKVGTLKYISLFLPRTNEAVSGESAAVSYLIGEAAPPPHTHTHTKVRITCGLMEVATGTVCVDHSVSGHRYCLCRSLCELHSPVVNFPQIVHQEQRLVKVVSCSHPPRKQPLPPPPSPPPPLL